MAVTTQMAIKVWRERFEAWKASGKNIAQWCRDNKVSYVNFFHWKNRLSNEEGLILSNSEASTQFIEITESSQAVSANSGIFLSFQEIQIHLSKDFDQEVLLRCLNTLKML